MKRAQRLENLAREADLRCDSLAGNLAELGRRARPANLAAETEEMFWTEVDRVTDELIDTADDFFRDGADWLIGHRVPVIGGALAAAAAAAAIWFTHRKTPVPLYAAYAMEDPDLMSDDDTTGGPAMEPDWSEAKAAARKLGDRTKQRLASARSKMADLSDEARERVTDAADFAAAAARDAADAAREAAMQAREAARDAGRWARRQPRENPATVILVALAAGALVGALLPSGRRRA